MNPKHSHTPITTRVRCPVCREPVYSRAGIHPQCAVKQNEPPKVKEKPPGAIVAEVPAGADGVVDVTAVGTLAVPETPVA